MRDFLKNGLLVLVTIVVCAVAAEGIARWTDAGGGEDVARHLDEVPRAAGVERAWYFSDPPPLSNRGPVPAAWDGLVRRVEQSGITQGTRRADMFKAWNTALVGDPCGHPYLRDAPGHLFVYDPPDGSPHPPYRFLPNATTPVGLVTNDYGFRGPPVSFVRTPRTIRIAFVGASTTVDAHHLAYSYPEFIGHWLNLWAASKRLDVRFEVLNAGRESINSVDIEAIVRQEVLPLRPDLVVYYEGANQFDLRTVAPSVPKPDPFARPAAVPPESTLSRWLGEFALVRRVRALLHLVDAPAGGSTGGSAGGGGEWPKPDYDLVWPAGLDEIEPDIGRADLPVNLSTILGNLDGIRAATQAAGGELALASFVWLVKDGMVLNPIHHKAILEYLNQGYAPFRYRDLERMAAFENRVFAKYALAHRLAFLDVARLMPRDPDLFVDAIHNTQTGVRLKAWVVLQELLPLVERHLANGTWPKADPGAGMPPRHPAFAVPPRPLEFTCKKS